MNYFQTNLKFLREKKGLEQSELASLLNRKSPSSISEWENGKYTPKVGTISDIAKIFNVDIDDLMTKNLQEPEVEIIGRVETMNPYKYVNDPVSAGNPENINGQDKYGTIYIPNDFMGKYANNPNIITMKVNGNSMNKIIPDGSLIGILTNISTFDLNNGDIVVFNDQYKYSVKRFYKIEDKIIFRPDSTEDVFFDKTFDLTETGVEIIGKVVMYSVIL